MFTAASLAMIASAQTITGPVREWSDSTGRKLSAALRGYDAGSVIFQTGDGKETRVPLSRLSKESQLDVVFGIAGLTNGAVQILGGSAPAPGDGGAAPTAGVPGSDTAEPVFSATWPSSLLAPDGLTQARYLEKESKPGSHLYRSRRFQYQVHSELPLSPQVMQDVARVFEGTYLLLGQSPFGMQATPVDGFFRAELFNEMFHYHRASGPVGSAGVYLTKEKKFMVPFESLGVKLNAGKNAYIRDRDFEVKTLVHELTHMMMHDVIQLIPKWLIEGSAEYVECIPYKYGTFTPGGIHGSVRRYNETRFRRSMIGPVTVEIEPLLAPPAPRPRPASGAVPVRTEVMPVPEVGFYHTSLLLTYYFMHLDGDKRGTRLLNFLNAVRAEKKRWDSFEREIKGYEVAMEAFFKKPGVQKLDNGRFQYPSHLTPPEAPKPPSEEYLDERRGWLHINLLLDGRTPAQAAAEAEAALMKAGLRVR